MEVQYEKLPLFCTHCKFLGHSIQHCKKLSSSTTHQGPRDIQRKAQNTLLNKHSNPSASLPHKKYVPVFESQEGKGEFPASTTDPGRVEETSAQDKVETSAQDKVEFLAKDTNQTVENLNLEVSNEVEFLHNSFSLLNSDMEASNEEVLIEDLDLNASQKLQLQHVTTLALDPVIPEVRLFFAAAFASAYHYLSHFSDT